MSFDRSAHRQQVARLVAHTAGGTLLLKLLGKGEGIPAAIEDEMPRRSEALPNQGAQRLERVTIAREVRKASGELFFPAGVFPRQGQHFTDPAGRLLTIVADRSVTEGPTLVYLCASAARTP